MARSLKKGPFVDLHLLKKAERLCLVSRAIDVPLRFEPKIEVTEAVVLV